MKDFKIFTSEEKVIMMELLRIALSDKKMFERLANNADLSDKVLKTLQDKILKTLLGE